MSVLSTISARLDAIGDRVNPIVIKETRQAVRSRAVVSILSLFVIVLLIAAMGLLLFSDPRRRPSDGGSGWETFLLFNSILLVVCGVFVPIYVAIRAAGDRSGVTADLLFTTTIRPFSVIWGKLVSGMLVTMLLFATAAPFVTVSYLLRGIDLPTIAYWLAFDTLVIFLAIQVAVFLAVLPTSIVIRIIIGLAAMFAGFSAVIAEISYTQYWGDTSVSVYDTSDWIRIGSFAATMLIIAGMLFVLSVACVSPSASNRAFLPRLYTACAIVVSYFVTIVAADQMGDMEFMFAWFSIWFGFLLIATLISSGERRDPGARVLGGRLMRRPLTRPLGILFSSGSHAGLLWCAVMTGVLVAGIMLAETIADLILPYGIGTYRSWDSDVREASVMVLVAMAMAIAYNLFAIALRDGPLKRFSKGTVMTPAITMLLIAAVSVTPPIAIALFGSTRHLDNEAISLLNPVSSMIWSESDMHGVRAIIALVLLFAAVLLNWKGIRRAAAHYRRVIPATPPPAILEGEAEADA